MVPKDAVDRASVWKSMKDRYYDQVLTKKPDRLLCSLLGAGFGCQNHEREREIYLCLFQGAAYESSIHAV